MEHRIYITHAYPKHLWTNLIESWPLIKGGLISITLSQNEEQLLFKTLHNFIQYYLRALAIWLYFTLDHRSDQKLAHNMLISGWPLCTN